MSNWQILLDTLTDIALKYNWLSQFEKSLEGVVDFVANNFTINDILKRFIKDYEESHRDKTRKGNNSGKYNLDAMRAMGGGDNRLAAQLLTKALMTAPPGSDLTDIIRLLRKVQEIKEPKLPTPELENCNMELPGASASVRLAWSEEKGRHVVCSRDVRMGDVLFVEAPQAAVVNQQFQTKFCHQCCQRVTDLFPCEQCNEVIYCSKECRVLSLPVHRAECGYLALLTSVGVAHLALRCLLVTEKGASHTMNNLQYHHNNLPPQELLQYATTAMLLAYFIEKTSYLPATRAQLSRHALCSILLKHILQLVVNAHAVVYSCLRPEPFSSSTLLSASSERVATGIYLSTAMMNHSCDPSVVSSFHGNVVVVRAARDMLAGEEILNCYGPHFRRMSREQRQQLLLDQYNFQCHCGPCSMPYDVMEIYSAYLCLKCCGPVVSNVCWSCGLHSQPSQQMLHYSDKAKQVLLQVDDDTKPLDILALITTWREARQALFAAHEVTVRLADTIARELARRGSYSRSLPVYRAVVAWHRARFGDPSPVLAGELRNLSVIAHAAAQELPKDHPESRTFQEASKLFDLEAQKQALLLYGQPNLVNDICL